MKRNFNYTGRKRITQDRVVIFLKEDAEKQKYFDATLRVDDLDFPGDARIYVEAFYKSSYMRFPLGTIAEPRVPEQPQRRLTEIAAEEAVRFRVKVVDETTDLGRILGDADNIAHEEDGTRLALLPVESKDLDSVVWRLDFEGMFPVLEVNNRIPNIKGIARKDMFFFSLVFPAIVQEVLSRILLHERGYEYGENLDDWRDCWIRFAMQHGAPNLPEQPAEPDDEDYLDDALAWVQTAVVRFCDRHEVCSRFSAALEEENDGSR